MFANFSDFPVLYVDGIVKRTLGSCIILAVAALGVAFFVGQYLAGAGVVLGLAGATVNQRLFQLSTVRYSTAEGELARKPYFGSVAARLGLLTVVAFALLFLVRPMGFGMVGGLVAFQVLLMANAFGALWHYQRVQLSGLGTDKTGPGTDRAGLGTNKTVASGRPDPAPEGPVEGEGSSGA
jgi:hypothetical protein